MKYVICVDNSSHIHQNRIDLELNMVYEVEDLQTVSFPNDESQVYVKGSEWGWRMSRFVEIPEQIVNTNLFCLVYE